MEKTIRNMINQQNDDLIFLTSEKNEKLSYGEFKIFNEKISRQLAATNIINSDRAAIVLPNGPLMASSFLSISSYMSAAPLNPSYKQEEFEFYLDDLKPKFLLVEPNSKSLAVIAAKNLNIPVFEMKISDNQPLGTFELFDKETDYKNPNDYDEALVLHTSGTTSRPKIVPLSNLNIFTSAVNISKSLKLTADDHCLNIMPLFHIHGLIAVLSASAKVGASVCASNGFNALKFLDLAETQNITWYSGVPTMHQAILLRAQKNSDKAKKLNLRFIRSSSASLPPAIFEQLNDIFQTPVIEAYGMTEATHQMASNPLPPAIQKPGLVGMPAGPEICIMNDKNEKLPQGEIGEICIKGDNVTNGYENNPEANKQSFVNDWFRTGDEGFFDEDGYLKISGRLKEIINKGGEKISPLEVDNILMDFPPIDQALCFGYKDKMLGEDIAVAIKLKENKSCTEDDIKSYANEKLAKFKIPKKIFIVEDIPKGATGKLQRIGLAKKFGLE
ncbi:MAG: AMP-dependent synthetase [Alphaproteobacteria bacterium]|jgi:acyl-CoA synthetase (AMP-forming)/AMP-acid ligase II|nr:MAG: AMP-dependent synthetase [Alphaproteobacteria bacterium]|tara:strand:+ start:300 stop:1802 length:1503 start_codon:yes stop_codon:yes gene_type:complete